MSLADFTYSSSLLGTAVTLGNLAIWVGLASAVATVVLYWAAMIRAMRQPAARSCASSARTWARVSGCCCWANETAGTASTAATTTALRSEFMT